MNPSSSTENMLIVVLGGWSPGPLGHLKRAILSPQYGCRLVEPRNLPMPPIPGSWCCFPVVVLMLLVFGILIYLSAVPTIDKFIIRLILLFTALVWFRFVVAVVVRSSIDRSIRIALKEIGDHVDMDEVLVIGFSWGGAVSCGRVKKRDFVGLSAKINDFV
mmetsp:Transcript_18713/g.34884  ORF Transcript_18713/g.34884 Transcript_18713/m.34884 type:complete len:161 (-) Transcript_18713:1295-1777(-)